ncbi:MAG: hypothetical protein QOH17_4303 [Pseudonocardiales bacterium]|nr:hypothetical protein [Pseudonocardiales bacterium]
MDPPLSERNDATRAATRGGWNTSFARERSGSHPAVDR